MSDTRNPNTGKSTAQVIYRRLADSIYVGGAVACAFMIYPMVFPAQDAELEPLSLSNIEFASIAPREAVQEITDPKSHYKAQREHLALALNDAGLSTEATSSLKLSQDYFDLLDHAGAEFLRDQVRAAQLDVFRLQEKASTGVTLSNVEEAMMKMESAKIVYYDHLLDQRD